MGDGIMRLRLIAACIFAIAVTLAVLGFRSLRSELEAERAAHAATARSLSTALEANARWKRAGEVLEGQLAAQSGVAEACLKREAQAARAAKEREAILREARIEVEAATPQTGVVDHETRRRIADRLNRPW